MNSLFKSGLKGLSDSIFSGIAGSVFKCVGVDYRSKPGIITAHQKLTKNSATTIDELCKHAVAVSDGSNLWFSAVSGKIWREVGGVYTLIHTTAIADEPFDAPTQFPTLNGTNQKFTISDDDQTGLDFKTSGTVRVLVVAGGGGGGRDQAGGGGAGEYVHVTSHELESDILEYTVTVGGGGAGATANTNKGVSGSNSVFDTLVALGGGGGGSPNNANGANGGSGGGGSGQSSGTGGSSTAVQGLGNAGGGGNANAGGGGGGSAGVGGGASGDNGGAGGSGTSNDITGSAVTYAVGGKGGNKTGGTGADGAVNTGNGGGGGEGTGANGGAGGSGIVVIRYKTDGSDGISPDSTGGTKTTSGADTVHTFTSSGTFTAVFTELRLSIAARRYNRAFPTPGNYMTIAEKWNETGDQRSWAFRLWNNGGTYKLVLSFSATGNATQMERSQDVSIPLGEWYDVAVTFSRTADEVKFYLNGVQVGSTQATLFGSNYIFLGTAGVGIGGQADNNTHLWNGYISDTRIWSDRVLSATEILDFHDNPSTFNEATNMVADWRFNNSLLDETANDNDLTNVGEIEFTEFGGTQPEMKTLGAEEHEGLVDEESANFIYWATEDRLWRIAVADIGTSWSLNGAFALFAKGDNTYHPMAKQNTSLFIGDKNVVASVSSGGIFTAETNFNLPINERILTLSPFDIDLIVGTEIGVKGRVLRWDTVSESWSTEDDVDNPVYAFIRDDNFVYASVGDYGQLYLFNGEKLLLVKQIQGSWSPTAKARVYHGSVSFWRNTPVFGLSNITGNPALQGVYGFGKHSNNYPATLSLDFPVSSGEFSGLEIGAIIVRGLDMWVAFKDGVEVGVDKVDWSNKYASSHIETTALSGAEDRVLLKTLLQATVPYFSLPANTAIAVGLKKAYEASFTALTMKTDTKRKLVYTKESNKDVIDPQLRIDLTVSGNNAPEFTDLLYDLTTPDTPK